MTIQKLERVMERIRRRNRGKASITHGELKRAIMYECGVHIKTYRSNKAALITLGWIKTHPQSVDITDKDITDG